jgi:hypothetical protein
MAENALIGREPNDADDYRSFYYQFSAQPLIVGDVQVPLVFPLERSLTTQ